MMNLLAQVVFLAAEGEDAPEGIDLVIPETEELIAGIIAFAIVFILIWWKVRPAIAETLAARQEAITGQLTEAETAKQEAEGLLEDYRQQLDRAKDEANQIVDDARQSADALRTDLVSKAEAEAESITTRAREEAVAEKERAAAQIRDEVAALSLTLAEKVVGDTVDAETQRSLVDRYIDELGDMAT